MDTPPTAIIDACVLYSAPVRDLVVRVGAGRLDSGPVDGRDPRRVDAQCPEEQPESQTRTIGAHPVPDGRGRSATS